ncbi:MAG TPA: alpha/beta fold hydrolase [Gaiellales bacterium]|nr:alpha/beta fold hydrolase [Gaiellales bacterium]
MTPTFVLLHGLTFDRRMWEPVAEALPAGADVLALDLPGHGATPPLFERGLEPVADWVHDAVTAAGIEAPIVVGHSIAGPIATIYAFQHPAAGVVSVDVSLHFEPFAAGLRAARQQLAGDGFAAAWGTFQESMQMDRVPDEHRELIRAGDHASQQVVLSYQADLLERPLAEVAGERDRGLDRLRAMELPYLAIFGDPIDPAERTWYAEALPQARVEVWPVGHHFPQLADPRRFADRLVEFARLTQPAATL